MLILKRTCGLISNTYSRQIMFTRNMFGYNYLEIDKWKFFGCESEKKQQFIEETFNKSGIISLSHKQVCDYLSSTRGDKLSKEISKAFLEDPFRRKHHHNLVLDTFLRISYDNDDFSSSEDICKVCMSSKQGLGKRMSRVIYLTHCYNNENHDAVLEAFENFEVTSNDEQLIVMASLYKTKTENALKKATEIMNEYIKNRRKLSRIDCIYSMLAIDIGYFNLAIDHLLSNPRISDVNDNIVCLAYIKNNEIGKAIDHLVTAVQSPKRRLKMLVFPEVMDIFGEAVKSAQNDALSKMFSLMCQELDERATLAESTLRESILMTVEPKPKDSENV